MTQKEKLLKILEELRTAEQHTISALNHNRDLQDIITKLAEKQ